MSKVHIGHPMPFLKSGKDQRDKVGPTAFHIFYKVLQKFCLIKSYILKLIGEAIRLSGDRNKLSNQFSLKNTLMVLITPGPLLFF